MFYTHKSQKYLTLFLLYENPPAAPPPPKKRIPGCTHVYSDLGSMGEQYFRVLSMNLYRKTSKNHKKTIIPAAKIQCGYLPNTIHGGLLLFQVNLLIRIYKQTII